MVYDGFLTTFFSITPLFALCHLHMAQEVKLPHLYFASANYFISIRAPNSQTMYDGITTNFDSITPNSV